MNERYSSAAQVIIPGLLAGALFSAAAAASGRREAGSAAAALNAPGHFYRGEAALHDRRISLRHTVPGVAVNTGAGLFWAGLMRMLLPRAGRRPGGALLAGAAVSSLAWVVDYHLIPRRLSPGVQEVVSAKSLGGIHALFALGLGLGAWLAAGRRR